MRGPIESKCKKKLSADAPAYHIWPHWPLRTHVARKNLPFNFSVETFSHQNHFVIFPLKFVFREHYLLRKNVENDIFSTLNLGAYINYILRQTRRFTNTYVLGVIALP